MSSVTFGLTTFPCTGPRKTVTANLVSNISIDRASKTVLYYPIIRTTYLPS